jgi:glycosyltransferase involved in cell wall biosynthesis
VIPYGAPVVEALTRSSHRAPFVFLSAGSQSVRKGVHYTLDAWRKIAPRNGSAELWLIGHMQLPERLLANLPGKVVVRPSVPKGELSEIYRRANVLVFPSLVEGFGMVITEAMAHGVSVITTSNTAGPELIEDHKNGFIVPVCDPDKLAEVMQWCLDNQAAVQEIGSRAAAKAASWQWGDYRVALASRMREILDART